ncbi:MAG: hypothetical protein NZ914_05045 [Gemmatales bacterium]|nr:hypothetical protein [Gemmatales bacterium]
MSTALRGGPVRRPARGPGNEEYLLRELQRTAERIRLVDLAKAGFVLAVMWATYLLAVAVVDQALRPAGLPSLIRQLLFTGMVWGSAAYAWFYLLTPALQKVTLLYAAWRLEKSARVTRHAITAYLDLRQRQLSPLLREALRREAQEDLQYTDPEAAAPHTQAMRWFFVLVALLVVLMVFALLVREQFMSLMARALWPFAQTPIPTNTRFELLAPERDGPYVEPHRQTVMEILVRRGQPVIVHVRIHGISPPQVWLDTWVQEGEQPYRRAMAPIDDLHTEWKFTLGASDLPASGLFFRVVGGDGQSRTYRLVEKLINPPEVRDFDITIYYPSYTNREPKKQTVGAIEALVGSEIELAVYGDQPMVSGELELEVGEPARQEILPLIQAPERDPQHQPNRVFLDAKLRVEEKWLPKARYGIRLRNQHGQTGSLQWYDLRLLTDQPPVVTLDQVNRLALPPADAEKKEPPTLQLPVGATVPVEGTANDDFAVDRVWLVLQEVDGDRRLLRIAHPQAETGPLQKANGFTPIIPATYQLTLDLSKAVVVNDSREAPSAAPIALRAGTKLRLWVEATDCKRPEPNLARSREIILELIKPENPPEKPESAEKPNRGDKPNPPDKPNPENPQKPDAKNQPPEEKPNELSSQNSPEKPQNQNQTTKPQDTPEKAPADQRPDQTQQQPSKPNPEERKSDQANAGQADKAQQGKPQPEKPQGGEAANSGQQQPNQAEPGPGHSDNQNPDKTSPQAGDNRNNPDQPQGNKTNPPNNSQAGKPNPQAGGNQFGDKVAPDPNNVNKSNQNQPQPGNQTPQGNQPEKPNANANAGNNAGQTPDKPMTGNPQAGNPQGNQPEKPNANANAGNNAGQTPDKPMTGNPQAGNPQGNQPEKPNADANAGIKPGQKPEESKNPMAGNQQGGGDCQCNQGGNNQGNASPQGQQGGSQAQQSSNSGSGNQAGTAQANQQGGQQQSGMGQPGQMNPGQQPNQGQQPGSQNAGNQQAGNQSGGNQQGNNQNAGNQPGGNQNANGQQPGNNSGNAGGGNTGQNPMANQSNNDSNASGGGNNQGGNPQAENNQQVGKPGSGPGGANPGLRREGEAGDLPLATKPMNPNPEFSNEAGDLTLDSLRKKLERGEIDKPTRELMDRLGVKNLEELRRLLQQKPEVVQAEMNRGQRQALGPSRAATRDNRSAATDANDRPVLPPELRDAYEDFTRRFRP